MDNEKCVKIALELDIDPLKIIMASDLDKAERAGQKSLWDVFMTRTQTAKNAGVTASLFLALVTNFVTPTPAKAAPALNVDSSQIYIMLNLRENKRKK